MFYELVRRQRFLDQSVARERLFVLISTDGADDKPTINLVRGNVYWFGREKNDIEIKTPAVNAVVSG